MFTGFRGSTSLLYMKVHRRGDVNRIDLTVVEQVLPFCIPSGHPELRGKRFGQIGACAADSHQVAVRQVAQRRNDTFPSDVTASNQSPAKRSLRCFVITRTSHNMKLFFLQIPTSSTGCCS